MKIQRSFYVFISKDIKKNKLKYEKIFLKILKEAYSPHPIFLRLYFSNNNNNG